MSNMKIDQVLAMIHTISNQAGNVPAAGMKAPAQLMRAATETGAVTQAQAQAPTGAFATLLKSGIDQANGAELQANDLAARFERGEAGVDLPQVMLETNKASLSFRMVAEVRNRLVSAYQDVMNMQL